MSEVLQQVRVLRLGLIDYDIALKKMREFTARRDADTADELWLLAHPPVYTLGLAAESVKRFPAAGGGKLILDLAAGGSVKISGTGGSAVEVAVLLQIALLDRQPQHSPAG